LSATSTSETALRERVCACGASLFRRGLTFGSTGNISVSLPDGGWLMTPTNASLGELDPASLSKLDAQGRHVDGDKPTKVGEKAATLKMLKHLYLARKTGNQDVWVYSPPKAYRKWVFDEIKGDDTSTKSKLQQEREVYSAKEREIMGDALQEAASWCQKVQINIATTAGEDMVKAWFMDSAATPQNLAQAISTLKDGFKKVETVCRSGQLIFSDEPGDRNSGGWKDWAFVYKSEAMKVVYLQGAFVKAGNSGKKTMCALTIVHELTHKILGTNDHRYDYDGLKPTATFPFAKAIDNADSWGYFAADICGMLSESDRKKTLS